MPGKGARLDTPEPLLISRRELASLMDLDAYYRAVESAFRAHAEGRATVPMPLHIAVEGGGFHAKGAFIDAGPEERFAAVKVNSNFPGQPARGLPTIQGAVLLYDAQDGRLLAILDSAEITSKRTAAAGAVAGAPPGAARLEDDRHLRMRRAGPRAACGHRPRVADRAGVGVGRDFAAAERFAKEMSKSLRFEVTAVREIADADVIVTATSAREPFLRTVSPGTFIAAIGADNPHKSEIHPDLMATAKVVTDLTSQAIAMGDLHHAPGVAVHAELGEILAGRKPGRESDAEIIVFDSTGVAIQDVAAAACAYQRAVGARSICMA
jgi:ornithine cyclodeaminase/alanine dehydrogenase-like protein (mu-crystallin family)